MQQTFINLPENIEKVIGQILSKQESPVWVTSAEDLHNRYLKRKMSKEDTYLDSFTDALGYVALRFPATYAQISGALLATSEMIPTFTPKTLLDIGSGPGTGFLAARNVWDSIETVVNLDSNDDFIRLGKQIVSEAEIQGNISWQQVDMRKEEEREDVYDVVIIANVLNEMREGEAHTLIEKAYKMCAGVLIIVEPGTSYGNEMVSSIASKYADSKTLLAPYINYSFVKSNEYWIHFPQKFIRPDFQRRIRQHMRDSSLMASDWEETKYCYVTLSKIPTDVSLFGRCVGPSKKQNGFLEVPILTEETIQEVKVMKRYKKEYNFAKELKWGQGILDKEDIFPL